MAKYHKICFITAAADLKNVFFFFFFFLFFIYVFFFIYLFYFFFLFIYFFTINTQTITCPVHDLCQLTMANRFTIYYAK